MSDDKNTFLGDRLALTISIFVFLAVFMIRFNGIERLYESSQHDLRAYLAAAHNIVGGRHIYKTHHQAIPEDPTLTSDVPMYLYPPLLGMLMIPTTLTSYDTFKNIWFFANLLFLFHGIFLAVSILPFHKWRIPAFFMISAVMLGSDMLSWLLRTAQADGFVIYICIWAFWFFEKQKWLPAAILIAMASWIKVTPGLFFIYLLTRGNLRFAIYASISGVALGLIQLAAVQGQFFYFFTDTIPNEMPNPIIPPSMQSLWSLSKLLTVPVRGRNVFDNPESFETLLQTLKIIVVGLTAVVLVRGNMDRAGRYLGLGVCCAASLLITDVSWMMRFIWNFVALSGVLYVMVSCKNRIVATVVNIVGMLALLLNMGFLWKSALGPLAEWKGLFIGGPGLSAFLSLLILFGFVMWKSSWIPVIQKIPFVKIKNWLRTKKELMSAKK